MTTHANDHGIIMTMARSTRMTMGTSHDHHHGHRHAR